MYNYAVKTAEILLIALSLSMDAFAVAVASGAAMKKPHLPHAAKMGFFFGGFQAFMPALGWLAGNRLKIYIEGFDHWIAFGLLLIVGGKMVIESFEMEEEQADKHSPFETGTLTVLSIATSIDALAVGLTFSMLKVSIAGPVMIIGAVTFAITTLGVVLGSKTGHFFENRAEAFGGLMLIAIGVKILFEHLGFLG